MDDIARVEAEQPLPSSRRWRQIAFYAAAVILFVAATGLQWGPALYGLFWSAMIRNIYVVVRRWRDEKTRWISPWFFVIAAVCALSSLTGQGISVVGAPADPATEQAASVLLGS
jgi:uncharacterized membrane protein YhaH (DUF805 family)